jgi:hypothetical protein
LLVKKHCNEAAAAVARKITLSVWHLFKGHLTPLVEAADQLRTKLPRIATVIGKDGLKTLGFADREAVVEIQIKSIQVSL